MPPTETSPKYYQARGYRGTYADALLAWFQKYRMKTVRPEVLQQLSTMGHAALLYNPQFFKEGEKSYMETLNLWNLGDAMVDNKVQPVYLVDSHLIIHDLLPEL